MSRRWFLDVIKDVGMLDQTDGDPLTKTFGHGEFEFDVEAWIRCVDFIDDPTESNLSTAVAQMDKFLRYYYRGGFPELRFGGEVERYDVVMYPVLRLYQRTGRAPHGGESVGQACIIRRYSMRMCLIIIFERSWLVCRFRLIIRRLCRLARCHGITASESEGHPLGAVGIQQI